MSKKFVPNPPESVALEKSSKRGPGRPRKIELLPANPKVKAIQKEREDHLRKNRLLKELRKNADSLDVLDQMMHELAMEAALLSFERSELERMGKDTTVVSGKKVTALRSLADLYFKKRDSILDQAFDLKSKRTEKFMTWILLVVRKSALKSSFTEEQINVLFGHISDYFEDDRWRDEAMEHIKS